MSSPSVWGAKERERERDYPVTVAKGYVQFFAGRKYVGELSMWNCQPLLYSDTKKVKRQMLAIYQLGSSDFQNPFPLQSRWILWPVSSHEFDGGAWGASMTSILVQMKGGQKGLVPLQEMRKHDLFRNLASSTWEAAHCIRKSKLHWKNKHVFSFFEVVVWRQFLSIFILAWGGNLVLFMS